MKISRKVLNKIRDHAEAEFPKESCGLIVNENKMEDQYIACPNLAETPEEGFCIDQLIVARAFVSGRMRAVVHSHTNIKRSELVLSAADEHQMKLTAKPWGIIGVDEKGNSFPEVKWFSP